MKEWKSPLVAIAAALLGGSVALAEGGNNQQTLVGAGLASSFLLIGVWVSSNARDD